MTATPDKPEVAPIRPTRSRLHRSELAVPASNVRMMEKAPSLGADIVMLDLEDAVAPDDKRQARCNVIDALGELDWSGCSVSLRINGLDTQYCYRDVVDVVERGGAALDSIMIPKVGSAADVELKTHRILSAMRQAAVEGKGAVSLDGRLIDAASIRMAENLLAKLEQIQTREQARPSNHTRRRPAVAAA